MSPNVFTVPLEATNALIGYIWKLVLKLHQSHATSIGHVVIFDPGIFHQERRGYSSCENGGHCQEGKPGKQPHSWNPMPTVKRKKHCYNFILFIFRIFFFVSYRCTHNVHVQWLYTIKKNVGLFLYLKIKTGSS